MEARRSQRVAEALREELGELVGFELTDPRLGNVDVVEVLVTPDLRLARVRVAVRGDAAELEQSIRVLTQARSFLRRQLAVRLELPRIPDLDFEPDLAPELSGRLGSILRRVRKGRPREGGEGA